MTTLTIYGDAWENGNHRCAHEDCRTHIPHSEQFCLRHGGRAGPNVTTDEWGHATWTGSDGAPLVPTE